MGTLFEGLGLQTIVVKRTLFQDERNRERAGQASSKYVLSEILIQQEQMKLIKHKLMEFFHFKLWFCPEADVTDLSRLEK